MLYTGPYPIHAKIEVNGQLFRKTNWKNGLADTTDRIIFPPAQSGRTAAPASQYDTACIVAERRAVAQGRRHGVDMTTPLLLEVAPEIDTNPTSFYRGRGRGSLRLQTPVIGSRSALAMSVHPTYFDLATPLLRPRCCWVLAISYPRDAQQKTRRTTLSIAGQDRLTLTIG